jgi:hypothetical protein
MIGVIISEKEEYDAVARIRIVIYDTTTKEDVNLNSVILKEVYQDMSKNIPYIHVVDENVYRLPSFGQAFKIGRAPISVMTSSSSQCLHGRGPLTPITLYNESTPASASSERNESPVP